jgi:16S rRNA (uracil1498-N3)-methyltransferase
MSKQAQIWRIFSDFIPEAEELLGISENEHHYIKNVLRLRPGETVEICDGKGLIAKATFEQSEKQRSIFKISSRDSVSPLHNQVIVVVGTPKPSALDELVSLTSEIGVSEIHFVRTERSQNKQEIRTDRLSRLAREALRISKSAWEPQIVLHEDLQKTKALAESATLFLCDESPLYEGKGNILNHLASHLARSGIAGRVVIFIGPEASFSDKERHFLKEDLGATPVSLGPNILRTPTAAVYAVAVALAHFATK